MSRSGRRLGLSTLVVVVVIGFGSFGYGPSGLTARTACAADSPDHVAIVVDFGTVAAVPGAPVGISSLCLAYSPGVTTGLDLLHAYSQQLGLPLRLAGSGLICAIASYPASGCGIQDGNHYLYWSYWSGTSAAGWQYQSVGPATLRVKPGVVEGWRFVDGASPSSGTGLEPPRNLAGGAASFVASNICPAPSSTPPPQPPTGPAPSIPAGAEPGSSENVPSAVPGRATPSARHPNTPSTTTPSVSSTPAAGVRDGTSAHHFSTSATAPELSVKQVRSAARSQTRHSDDSAIIGTVAALAAVVVLVSLGILRVRRRAPR